MKLQVINKPNFFQKELKLFPITRGRFIVYLIVAGIIARYFWLVLSLVIVGLGG